MNNTTQSVLGDLDLTVQQVEAVLDLAIDMKSQPEK